MSAAPLWNKSMARFASAPRSQAKPSEDASPAETEPALPDDATLAALGLRPPPKDRLLLTEFLKAEDAADGAIDAEGFARGIRRAVRIQFALTAKLHRGSGLHWKQWVEAHFKVGYACLNRYQVAARLQIELIRRKMPLLENEAQSRVLAPLCRHEKFWEKVGTFSGRLPAAKELQVRLPILLGLAQSRSDVTQRIQLHRALVKAVQAVPDSDDELVGRALDLVREAMGLLEKGGAT